MTHESPEYLTLNEVADVLQVTVRTVSRYIRRGDLHPLPNPPWAKRLPVRFTRAELERFIRAHGADPADWLDPYLGPPTATLAR